MTNRQDETPEPSPYGDNDIIIGRAQAGNVPVYRAARDAASRQGGRLIIDDAHPTNWPPEDETGERITEIVIPWAAAKDVARVKAAKARAATLGVPFRVENHPMQGRFGI